MPLFAEIDVGKFRGFSQSSFVQRHTPWANPDHTRRGGAWAEPEPYEGSCEGIVMMYVKADCSLDAFLAAPLAEVLATIRGFQNMHDLVHRDNYGQLDVQFREALRLNGNWKPEGAPSTRTPEGAALPTGEEFSSCLLQAIGQAQENPSQPSTPRLIMANVAFRAPLSSSRSGRAGSPSYEDLGHLFLMRRDENSCKVFDPNLGERSQIPIHRVRTALRALLSHYAVLSIAGWKVSRFCR